MSRRLFWWAIAALVLLALLPFTSGLAQDATTLSVLSVDDSAFPSVSAILSADRYGVPIADIPLRDLQIEESGHPALPISVDRAIDVDLPLAVIVTLDVSGSMEAGDTLAKAKAAASTLIRSLRASDQVGVISFADDVQVNQPLSTNHEAAVDAVGRLQIRGATALYDAVVESSRLAAQSGFRRRAVILLTDGVESGETHTFGRDDALAAAAAGTPFYTVGVGTEVDRALLEDLARRSGGRYFPAAGSDNVPDIYATLESVLRGHAIVTLRSNAPAALQDRWLSISLRQGSDNATAHTDYVSRRQLAGRSGGVGDSGPPVVAIAALALVGMAIVLAAGSRRLQRRVESGSRGDDAAAFIPISSSPVEGPVAAELQLIEATPVDGEGVLGQTFVVESPITVGSGPACAIRLPSAPGVAPQQARIWIRDGRLMVHHLAAGHTTVVDGSPITWASLTEGDEIQIGPYVLRFVALRRSPGSGRGRWQLSSGRRARHS